MTGLDVKAPSFKLWQALLAGGASEDEATVLMNGYAHELADRIRAEMPHESYAYVGGWEGAADLIDPEAS